jgi:filamentous hemagglutinin family protein
MYSRASLNHVYRTVWNQALGCTVAVAENATSHCGVGGTPTGSASISVPMLFRVGSLSLAVALCWGLTPQVHANPIGGVAIQGQATFDSSQPGKLLVTTQNGAGTNSSAINWQSFSIPAGNTTRIEQPNAASMSINRVVTNTPSVLFGTLSSNGSVVLVNQSGIAVGSGALIDTAGFTASAVGMTETDAIAGRLRFAGNQLIGNSSGALSVQGNLIARGGDVVLVAPSIDLAKTAVVEAQGGSVVLAAGQSVEVTGRGLEGITMQVQAPTDQAVNLGTLRGDAVGVFAGTLKHSGLIQANRLSIDGGRVVLKASGDAIIEGSGQIQATSQSGNGGRIEVLGNRVALNDSAALDASGSTGGGTVLVGGDAHGDNVSVLNARRTFVSAAATIKADATGTGDGGKVVVWADEATHFGGSITAKGGVDGGNGGWVETSGKQTLGFDGRVDTTAPMGATGSLLLDPSDITIQGGTDTITWVLSSGTFFDTVSPFAIMTPTTLQNALSTSSVTVDTTSGLAGTGNISVSSPVSWSSGNTLKLKATAGITFTSSISGNGPVGLVAGTNITNNTGGVGVTAPQLEMVAGGNISMIGNGAVVVDTLAVSAGGAVTIDSNAPNAGLTIGTVGATSGMTASGGNLTFYENNAGKNLLINQNVSSSATLLMSGGTGTATVAAGKSVSATASQLFASGGVTVNGTLSGSSSVILNSLNSSISTGSGGLVSAPQIDLQTNASASGDIGSSGSPLRTSGSNFYVGPASAAGPSGVYISNSGNMTILRNATSGTAPVQISTSGNLNLSVPVSSGASGNAVVLAASGNFSDGGNELMAPNGRWLVFSTQPSSNSLTSSSPGAVKNSYAFSQYGASYGSAVMGSGNGVIYSTSPTLSVSTSVSADKVYDGGTSSNLNSSNVSVGGASISNIATGVGSDVLTLSGSASFDSKNVGVGKTISFSSFGVSAVDSGSKPVYGYVLPGGTTGTITQRPLSVWTGGFNNDWNYARNWDGEAIPDGLNVAAVSIPTGSNPIVFDASIGSTTLEKLISGRPLLITGGVLQVTNELTAAGFSQTGGTVSGTGAFKVNGTFNQTGGSVSMATIDVVQSSGGLIFSNLKAPSVSLVASSGSITEAGEVTTAQLSTTSNGGTILNGAGNRVSAWKSVNTGGGAVELVNLGVLNIQGISNIDGNILVSNTGGITTTGPVTAPAGRISITANSPLTIGVGGVSSSGNIDLSATNATSSGDMLLNGTISSSAGAVNLNAANNLTQNGTVYGALGVNANVGGVLTFASSAKSGITPVSYLVGGKSVTSPPSTVDSPVTPVIPVIPILPPLGGAELLPVTFDEVKDAAIQVNLVTTFLDKFEIALQTQNDGKPDKDKNRNELVVEGEICRP